MRTSRRAGSFSIQGKAKGLFAIDDAQGGGGDKVRVTFWTPPIEGCKSLYLVGWFDEWKESAFPMEPREDGGWELTLELDRGCEYLYRFRTEDGIWLRDPSTPPGAALFGLNTSFYLSEAGRNPIGR
jgi:1,4-alpha-glucan branching enzyme